MSLHPQQEEDAVYAGVQVVWHYGSVHMHCDQFQASEDYVWIILSMHRLLVYSLTLISFSLQKEHHKKHYKRRGQAHTFVDLLKADTGVPRDCLPAAMDDRVGWRKKVMEGRLRPI